MKKPFKLYWQILFRPNLFSLSGLVSLAFLVGFSGMATIALTVPLMDAVFGGHANAAGYSGALLHFTNRIVSLFPSIGGNQNYLVLFFLVLMSLAAILNSIFLFIAQYFSVAVSQNVANKIKLKLFSKVLHGEYSWLVNQSRGTLLYDVNNPPQSVARIIDLFGRMSISLFQALLVIGLMVYFSWKASLVLGFLSLLWWGRFRVICSRMSASFGRKIYEVGQEIGRLDVDAVDGIKVVKTHNLQMKILASQNNLLEQQKKPKLYSDMLTRGIILLNEALAGIVVIFLGFAAFVFGWIQMSFPEMVAFMFAIKRASPSLGTFNSMYLEFYKELKNLKVIDEMFHEAPQEQEGELSVEAVETVCFDSVSFTYPSKESPTLDAISCEMRRGEITAIVGPSGAGKSTMVNLLLRFYPPAKGKIKVGGVDLSSLVLSSWRQKVGYVSQDIFLFNDTIFQNILLWKEGVSRNDLESAAKQAQIHDFILSLPKGYDTIVGDRGIKLSGGQCQRIAIAREILKQPEVIIFDEATSALDNLTEKAVYDAILALRQNAIVIVIAHRLSTVREADQIVVLRSGIIDAIGSHESLMGEKGLYARLHQVHFQDSVDSATTL